VGDSGGAGVGVLGITSTPELPIAASRAARVAASTGVAAATSASVRADAVSTRLVTPGPNTGPYARTQAPCVRQNSRLRRSRLLSGNRLSARHSFAQAFLRDTTYDLSGKARRPRWHLALANRGTTVDGARTDEAADLDSLLTYHLEAAAVFGRQLHPGSTSTHDNCRRAADQLARQAADAPRRQDLRAADGLLERAFRARACSVFVVDDQTGDLVFEAVAGEGQDHLVGTRFSAGTGIAGWVGASGQPLIADDLSGTSFSQQAASETGYVPTTIAAAPILHEGRCIGVLEVLDRDSMRDELETLELVGLLSAQAAAGIALLQQVRHSARYPTPPRGQEQTSGSVRIESSVWKVRPRSPVVIAR
jgi:hypothetical protein